MDKLSIKYIENIILSTLNYIREEEPGIALGLIYNKELIYNKVIGYANLELRQKISLDTNFRLASITKQFTAFATLRLIEKSLLKLDTKLTNIFKDFPKYGSEIRIFHLLTHTSGILDYENLLNKYNITNPIQDSDVYNILSKENQLFFKPGDDYKYSNSGYCILKQIIEKISGISYKEFLTENIFKPLGMNNTDVLVENKNFIKGRAYGYKVEEKNIIEADQSITSQTQGDGGIYSNINDLIKRDNSLDEYKILNKNLTDMIFQNNKLNNGNFIESEDGGYGFGWFIKDGSDHKIVYHDGISTGFRNCIYKVPDKNLSIILLSNRTDKYAYDLSQKIFEHIETLI